MKLQKDFEIELQRSNVTPAKFLADVRFYVDKRGGHEFRGDLDLNYFSSGDDINFDYHYRTQEEAEADNHYCKAEKSVSKPYMMQTYIRGFNGTVYNEICEFEFDDEKTGHGYYYLLSINEVNE